MSAQAWTETGQELLAGAPEPERRHATVVFADLAGFTRMSREVDPEQMVEILGAYFEVADSAMLRHGGRLDKHIGDAVMAVFGVPRAHGDEVIRALRAATEVHAGLDEVSRRFGREVRAHIGVATGEVLAGVVGSRHLARYTVLGDAANLASRLDSLARAGEILASDAVREAAGSAARWQPRGALEIKGFEAPVAVWCLIDLPAPQEVALVGRDDLVRRGEALIAQPQAAPRLLTLSGEPGVGKTALLMAWVGAARRAGLPMAVISLPRAVIAETDTLPVLVSRAIADALFGSSDALFQSFLADAGEAVALGAWDLLVLDPPDELGSVIRASAPGSRAARRDAAFARLVRTWAGAGGIVAIDDAQHLDQAGAAALTTWAAMDLPVRWLVAGRTVACAAPGGEIQVTGLDDPAAAALVRGIGGVPDDRIAAIVARAGGNPFYLRQLALSGTGELPGTVHSVVLARLDALPADTKRAAQAAATLGARVPATLLEAVGIDAAPLIAEGIVRRQGPDLVFDQDLVRDAAAASLVKSERRRLHRQAADWHGDAAPERRAEHLELAEAPEAARAWHDAARIRESERRTAHALSLVDRGLAAARAAEDVQDLRLLRAELLVALQRPADAAETLDALDADRLDGRALARAVLARCELERLQTLHGEMRARFEERRAIVERAGDPLLRARLLVLHASALFMIGDAEAMEPVLREARRHAQAAGDLALALRADSGIADMDWIRGRARSARRRFGRIVRTARENGLPDTEVANLVVLASCRFLFGQHAQADAERRRCVSLARRIGNFRSEVLVTAAHLGVWAHGDPSDEDLDEAQVRELLRTSPLGQFGDTMLDAYLLSIRFWTDDRSRLAGDARGMLPWVMKFLPSVFGALAHGVLAAVTDDADERASATARALEIADRGIVNVMAYQLFAVLTEAALQRGDADAAVAMAGRMEAHFALEPVPVADATIARARLLAHPSPDPAALRAVRRKLVALRLDVLLPRIDAALAAPR